MNEKLKSILFSLTGSDQIISEQLIQKLWSGYGELTRVNLNNKNIIIKKIQFPSELNHPKGWNSDLSHKRKVKSYQIETSWYRDHNHIIPNSYFPRYLSSGEIDDVKYLILEDLQDKEFKPKGSIIWFEVKLCLKWLAFFHAKHLGLEQSDLWQIGTYWHLGTRPDELKVLQDQDLIIAAPLIDKKLNDAQYKTIVHGDAKLENFLFNNNEVSAVDFQYVGGGVGVKDLAYFLSSIYNQDELIQNELECLDYYFIELTNALKKFHPKVNTVLLENEWRELFPYAWCDFYRFLKGWSPGHYKINSYSEQMKEKVLKCF